MAILVCCQRKMSKEYSGIDAVEYKDQLLKEPYKIWSADLFECGECGKQIVSDFARQPGAEHWEKDFNETLAKAKKRAATVTFY